MVSLQDIWTWLGTYSDNITSILSIVAIVFALYVARKSPKWQYEAEYKINIIQDIFPKLTADIRTTIYKYKMSLEDVTTEYDVFPFLFELFMSGKTEHIKIIDESLYENLIKIKDELVPLIYNLKDNRENLQNILVNKWCDYLNSLEGIHINIRNFANTLYQRQRHEIWKEDYDSFLTTCKEVIDDFTKRSTNIKPPTESDLLVLRRIAESEMNDIMEDEVSIQEMIKVTIETSVIPRLEEKMGDPF